jgi:hypothetical protein
MTKREQIIEILNDLRRNRGSLDELSNNEIADEILALDLFEKEFCLWLVNSEWWQTSHGRWQNQKTYEMKDTLDELYNYWLKEVKNERR